MNKRVSISILMTIALCGISLGLFKLWLFIGQSVEQETTSEFLSETSDKGILEGSTETKIPQSASDLHGLIDGFREITAYVRFTIPASDLEYFLSSTACKAPLSAVDASFAVQMMPKKDW